VAPDSFFDGAKYSTEKQIIKQAELMLKQGAGIIDIGAVSTRPGSEGLMANEEIKRLLPAVKSVRKYFPQANISIDTYRSEVAKAVIEECSECIVNDVSGGNMDEKMFEMVGHLGVPYILMHMKGTPQNMQHQPIYEDIVREISLFFSEKIKLLYDAGAKDVIIDPGFGFGKTLSHNYELLNRLDSFRIFQLPLMVGLSRKSMIYKVLESTPENALNGSTVANTLALMGGANILRVHDVKEASEAVKIFNELIK
jgi:dihydropteroate synthase